MSWSQIFLELTMERGGPVFGESETVGYEKQIVLLDFDWDMKVKRDTHKGMGAGRETKRTVELNEIELTKRFDVTSTRLYSSMANREKIKTGRISVPQGFGVEGAANQGKRDAFVLEFSDGYIESVSLDMVEDGNAMVLQEVLSVRFAKIKIEVTPQNPDGTYARVPKIFRSDLTGMTTR